MAEGRSSASQAAAAPAETEPRFQTLFEQAPFSVQLLALDGRTLRVNKAWEELWQGSKEYVLSGYNIFEDAQLRASGALDHLRKAFAGESVTLPIVRYDPKVLGKPGRARWVTAHAHPIRDAEGRVREVMLIHEDVTDRMQAESELRQAEERLRLATDAGNIGIWEWDLPTQRVTWSDRVYALHGLKPGQFGGRAEDFQRLVHPDDLPALWRKVETAIQQRGAFSAEFRARLPDGAVRWLSTWARTHAVGDGPVTRLIGATISIDGYKNAEAALKASDRRKDEFLAMLAHELRNPLAPISMAAQLLQNRLSDADTLRQASEIIARQVRHMTHLVDDLLDVSRVTRGLIQLDLQVADLHALVTAAIEQVRPLIESRGHILTTWTDAGRLYVRADRTRLIQVLVNLLNNAAKYTPSRGQIAVRTEVRDGQVIISVADNGLGIDPGLLPHVFDLFTQGARTLDRTQGGLGIGLALVKSLVELHGGAVRAASAGPGKGSTFSIRLPLTDEPAPERAAGSAQRRDRGPPRRIMVVDDNADAAQSLASFLRFGGHTVEVCTDAASALAAATRNPPEVFVLDLGLPETDGLELARRLRSRPETARAMLIALTGYGQAHDRALTEAAGFDHHFVKPLETEKLEDVLARMP